MSAHHLIAIGPVHLLRVVADLLAFGDGAVGAQHVFGDAQLIVAEAGIPGEQDLLGMLHGDVHGVGHFAAVLPQVDAAGHGHGARNLQVQHLVPEGKLVAHVLVHVAAGVVPEEAPVDVAVGVEVGGPRPRRGSDLPDDVLRRHVGVHRPRPLRLAVRRVAVHVGVDGGDLAHIRSGLRKFTASATWPDEQPLVADLHGALAGLLEGGAHALGVVHGERHGLFLVDVLAGVQRGDEVLAVQVLRGGDQDGVDGLVVEQVAVVEIGLGSGHDLLRVFQALGVDVGESQEFGIGAIDYFADQGHATIARADDAEANAIVGSQHVGGGQRAGQAGCDLADEIAA